jgi:hypothetical protein
MKKTARLVNSTAYVKKRRFAPDGESPPRYGYLLTLRALAEAAARLGDRPAALRVLTVLASYMDGRSDRDPRCRVSRSTVADALGLRRQAVQQHLATLKVLGILAFETANGETTTFAFAPAFVDPLRSHKPRADAIAEGRARRKAERKAVIEV